jgi:hypothetical protein
MFNYQGCRIFLAFASLFFLPHIGSNLISSRALADDTKTTAFLEINVFPTDLISDDGTACLMRMMQLRRTLLGLSDTALKVRLESELHLLRMESFAKPESPIHVYQYYVLGQLMAYPGEIHEIAILGGGETIDDEWLKAVGKKSGLRSVFIRGLPSITTNGIIAGFKQSAVRHIAIDRCVKIDEDELRSSLPEVSVQVW